MRPVALTIAGSDSGGGAGIVADVRTFSAHGVWPAVAITAVTAQNSLGVHAVRVLDPADVLAQIESVVADLAPRAAKTGMLGDRSVAEAVVGVAGALGCPLVVDPVLVSTTGTPLLEASGAAGGDDSGPAGPAGAADAVRRLLAAATVVTPNLAEAAVLTGQPVRTRDEMLAAARALVGLGCAAALVTGGHLAGEVALDCLVIGADPPIWLGAPRVPGGGAHGTGCVLSAAITARLALGATIEEACRAAKGFTATAIESAARVGSGPKSADPLGQDRVRFP